MANGVNPDQMPHFVVSDLGVYPLLKPGPFCQITEGRYVTDRHE